jgi:hypothetical protein
MRNSEHREGIELFAAAFSDFWNREDDPKARRRDRHDASNPRPESQTRPDTVGVPDTRPESPESAGAQAKGETSASDSSPDQRPAPGSKPGRGTKAAGTTRDPAPAAKPGSWTKAAGTRDPAPGSKPGSGTKADDATAVPRPEAKGQASAKGATAAPRISGERQAVSPKRHGPRPGPQAEAGTGGRSDAHGWQTEGGADAGGDSGNHGQAQGSLPEGEAAAVRIPIILATEEPSSEPEPDRPTSGTPRGSRVSGLSQRSLLLGAVVAVLVAIVATASVLGLGDGSDEQPSALQPLSSTTISPSPAATRPSSREEDRASAAAADQGSCTRRCEATATERAGNLEPMDQDDGGGLSAGTIRIVGLALLVLALWALREYLNRSIPETATATAGASTGQASGRTTSSPPGSRADSPRSGAASSPSSTRLDRSDAGSSSSTDQPVPPPSGPGTAGARADRPVPSGPGTAGAPAGLPSPAGRFDPAAPAGRSGRPAPPAQAPTGGPLDPVDAAAQGAPTTPAAPSGPTGHAGPTSHASHASHAGHAGHAGHASHAGHAGTAGQPTPAGRSNRSAPGGRAMPTEGVQAVSSGPTAQNDPSAHAGVAAPSGQVTPPDPTTGATPGGRSGESRWSARPKPSDRTAAPPETGEEADNEAAVPEPRDETAARVDAALVHLAGNLKPRNGGGIAQPRVVRSDAGRIDVLLSRPDPSPAAPWRSEASGMSWVLGADVALPPAGAVLPLPSLVTIGTSAPDVMLDLDDYGVISSTGSDIFVNLEAYGVLALVGDGDACRSMARAIAGELAARPKRSIAVELVGSPLDDSAARLDGVDRHRSWDEVDTSTIATSAGLLDAGGWPHTWAARASGLVFDGWAATIWVAEPSPHPRYREALDAIASRPGAGSVLVVVGDDPGRGLRIHLDSKGGFRIPDLHLRGNVRTPPAS